MTRVENGDSIVRLLNQEPAYEVKVWLSESLYWALVTRTSTRAGGLYFARTPSELMDDVGGFVGGYDD